MSGFIKDGMVVYELGAGAGLSREFLKAPSLRLTDVKKFPWIDEQVDALHMPFADGSVDVLIANAMLHHLATPRRFFEEAGRVLKKGGFLLINDAHAGLFLRALLWLTRQEGWDYDVDVFSSDAVANDPKDPWSANCAIPQMLFHDAAEFERQFPAFMVRRKEFCECLIFPLSGGVTSKVWTLQLPRVVLSTIDALDDLLIRLSPATFALMMRVVIEKR